MKNKITMNSVRDDFTLKEAFENFIFKKKSLNLSDETIKYYNDIYRYFSGFYGEDSLCINITDETVSAFINHLRSQNEDIADTSINTYLRGLRSVLYFFMEKGYTKQFKIELRKAEKKVKETYTDNEINSLLKKPDLKKCSFSEYRNWVMVTYLLGTGNRLSTLSNLRIKDIDFDDHEIVLRKVKNAKQYVIPLSASLEKVLLEYLQYRKGEPDNFLFCNQYGNQLKKDAITTAIARYNHSRGVTKTSVHIYRHTFAKKWILNGGDIFWLQKILGHSTLDMVKEYVNMFGGDLKNNFDRFNPLDNIEGFNEEKRLIKMKKQKTETN